MTAMICSIHEKRISETKKHLHRCGEVFIRYKQQGSGMSQIKRFGGSFILGNTVHLNGAVLSSFFSVHFCTSEIVKK